MRYDAQQVSRQRTNGIEDDCLNTFQVSRIGENLGKPGLSSTGGAGDVDVMVSEAVTGSS